LADAMSQAAAAKDDAAAAHDEILRLKELLASNAIDFERPGQYSDAAVGSIPSQPEICSLQQLPEKFSPTGLQVQLLELANFVFILENFLVTHVTVQRSFARSNYR
jgi:hypothetical protein